MSVRLKTLSAHGCISSVNELLCAQMEHSKFLASREDGHEKEGEKEREEEAREGAEGEKENVAGKDIQAEMEPDAWTQLIKLNCSNNTIKVLDGSLVRVNSPNSSGAFSSSFPGNRLCW